MKRKSITKILKLMTLFCLCVVFMTSSSPNGERKNAVKTVVIDAGHGGKDPGCIGHGGEYEKNIALNIALKLGQFLKDSLPNVNVIYTRTDDHFIELWKRADIANKNKADLFISIHCNASTNKSAHGNETYVMGLHKTDDNLNVSKRENQAVTLEDNYQENEEYLGYDPNSEEGHIILSLFQNAHFQQSLMLAENVQTKFKENILMRNLGVKQAGFLVLWKTSMPSVLVETGFLTNPKDYSFLNSHFGQEKTAWSIFKAINHYNLLYSSLD